MGWFTGKVESGDASKANTISDKEYRAMQARAAKANPKRAETFSEEATRARNASNDNYAKRWWN